MSEQTEQLTPRRLGKATASQTPIFIDHTMVGNVNKRIVPGYYDATTKMMDYHDTIKQCRWFYTYDPIAGTVIDRMADMAITTLRNRKKTRKNADAVDEKTLAYFDALAERLRPVLKSMALEYMLHGMVIPDYVLNKVRGNLLSEKLGRTRYTIPEQLWIRNPDHIRIRRRPIGMERQVYVVVPPDDVDFIMNKGKRNDGSDDTEYYNYLLKHFPEYIRRVQKGDTTIPLDNVRPILRKLVSYADYPSPYLVNALSALQHKAFLKAMDKGIASRAIEAIRQIKTGDKDFPADEDDITALEKQITQNSSSGERVFNLFTNHTVEIAWHLPPLDALLNEAKYAEPNADIFLALGFPRILTVGETLRSNASDSKIAALGPKATLDEVRDALVVWLKGLYAELAEENGFTRVPEPYFSPIATSDYTALVQFSIQALEAGAISKDTVAQLYGSDYETEADQIETEIDRAVPSPKEKVLEQEHEFQRETQDKNLEQQEKQNEQQANNNNTGETE